MSKDIFAYGEVQKKIENGINKLAFPVIQTLSPKGKNVLYLAEDGTPHITNDGVTIAKQIQLYDPVENLIVKAIRQASLKTNRVAGDGTTTTILFAQRILREGFRLITRDKWSLSAPMNPIVLKKELETNSEILLANIKMLVTKAVDDKNLEYIASISANNDPVIAKDVVEIVKAAGENGSIIIDDNTKEETEIVKDLGFVMESGMAYGNFINQTGRNEAMMTDVKVLITDKRIYYPAEAMAIMKAALDSGHKDLVVIAKDFIGQAPNVFITNHEKGNINLILIKDKSAGERQVDTMEDLAAYLGCKLVSDKKGELTTNITADDFGTIKKIVCNSRQTLIVANEKTKEAQDRIDALKKELDNVKTDNEKKTIEQRLASLTTGVVTLKVGGKTSIEIIEKKFRYEDAINAARNSIKHGWVIGGGVTMIRAYEMSKDSFTSPEMRKLFKALCHASLQQIAINCDKNFYKEILPMVEFPESPNHFDLFNITSRQAIQNAKGYDALTDQQVVMVEQGIIEPFPVLEQAIKNSISVSCAILSGGYIIVDKEEDGETN